MQCIALDQSEVAVLESSLRHMALTRRPKASTFWSLSRMALQEQGSFLSMLISVSSQSSCRVNRHTLSGYFLAGRRMAWWPVSRCHLPLALASLLSLYAGQSESHTWASVVEPSPLQNRGQQGLRDSGGLCCINPPSSPVSRKNGANIMLPPYLACHMGCLLCLN